MKKAYKQLIFIFVISFVLNTLWEHLHAVMYVHYQGNPITSLILLRAALFDASFITVVAIPFLKKRRWVFITIAVLFAIGLEIFALQTGRWAYTETMPIIPLIGIGLTPTIQLGFLGYVSIKTSEWILNKRDKI